ESSQVNECYYALFEQNNKGVFWVLIIARSAFSTDKLMKYHINQYLVDFKNGGPSYSLAEAIMTNELAGHSQNEQSRQSSSKSKPMPATAFQNFSSIMLSQDEIDELFEVNQY
ncbi:5907_t:CDS:2, partial [Dentiscutata heterogama]